MKTKGTSSMMAYYVLLQSTWEEKLSFCPPKTTATAMEERKYCIQRQRGRHSADTRAL